MPLANSINLRIISRLLIALLLLCSLAAYNVFGIPLQWIGQFGIVALALWMLAKTRPQVYPGLSVGLLYILWALVITALRVLTEDLEPLLPIKATSTYWGYLTLRFLAILSFISAAFVANWLARREGTRPMLIRLSWLGILMAGYALYVYVAQVKGWPEPPRSRLGTGGHAQKVVFSYNFHRAMGSFREPSHLAEWLILPVFTTIIVRRWATLRTTLLLGCLLLTGSLTGLIGVAAGYVASAILLMRHAIRHLPSLIRPMIPLFSALILSSILVVANKSGSSNILGTVWERIEPIFSDGGLTTTNRNYVYQYYDQYPIPVLGQGIGNANIRFSRAYQLETMGSFLNLYIANLYAVGVIGFMILVSVLAYPLIRIRKFVGAKPNLDAIVLVGAYIGWLFVFFSHSEELSIHFGIIYGLLVGIGQGPTLNETNET